MHHITEMLTAKKTLEALGYEIETPNASEANAYNKLSPEERAKKKDHLIREHLNKISESDAVLIFNGEKNGVSGYIGGNSLMEMAFAYAQGIEIFVLNDARTMGYADEIYGMQPIELDGKVAAIDDYFQSLPKTFVSSKSPTKLLAVSRGMRKAGIRTLVVPKPTESAVAAQPKGFDETHAGAQNRHEALHKALASTEDAAYLATVESGLLPFEGYNDFSSTVVILERVGGAPRTGLSVELELPKHMTDKVPSVYPDLGELVQAEYGSKLKDPFPFFTNGRIDRLKLVEAAVFNVAAQLSAE